MKKRKIKLFASVASLAMVAAVMGVGVWAATQQAVNVNSTVQFSASGLVGNLTLAVSGDSVTGATASTDSENVNTKTNLDVKTAPKEIANFKLADTAGAQTGVNVALTLADVGGSGAATTPDGFYSQHDGTITYTFQYTNTAEDGSVVTMTASAASNEYWEYVAASSTATAADIGTSQPGTVTVVFQYLSTQTPATELEATTHDLPTITLNFVSTKA